MMLSTRTAVCGGMIVLELIASECLCHRKMIIFASNVCIMCFINVFANNLKYD